MRIAVLGTGIVGRTLAGSLAASGHEVCMGSRSAAHEGASEWATEAGDKGSNGTFADAAAFGEVVLNCTAGIASLEALESAGADNLAGKVLIDLANPLDFSQGMPPTLTVCNDDSLGEQIQRRFPDTKVVKTFNTLNCGLMVAPEAVPGDHLIFVSGDHPDAKARVRSWFREWFGWRAEQIVDLGGIETARGTEMMLPMWINLMGVMGTPFFNFEIQKGETPA